VQYVKHSGAKTFVIIDAGMHTLIRPALYGAFHFIWPVRVRDEFVPLERKERMEMPNLQPVDIVGPICESGDFLAKDRLIPPVSRGDLIAVFSAGAYGHVMASRYNSHGLPAEVLVDGDEIALIRKRETYFDLVEHEMEPASIRLASL
jgi:diaminopimelate decarboxylase